MQYTSCFVGIPLPDKFQNEFEKTLDKVKKLYPNWQIVYPKTPHVTVYYLDKQSQSVLPQIARAVSKETRLIKSISLKVQGFDFFAKEDSRQGIIFLNVIYPTAFENFNHTLTNKLNNYHAVDNNLPFHPHVTIARINEPGGDSNLKNSVKLLNSKIDQINWEFAINEVAIYGVNSRIQPQSQKRLISIKFG